VSLLCFKRLWQALCSVGPKEEKVVRAGITLLALAAAIAILAASVPAMAAEGDSPTKAAYLRYCSACHGESGKGDGVVSHLMRPKPTDLTRLAKENKGEFPYARIMHVIDGRETVRAHGDPDMPVWGDLFKAEGGMTYSQQAEVRGKVMLITEHLSTIQEK
jgi:mono/diheme cytochrome c family protein